ncbi:MAG: glycosyltransferase family 39 protein [Anaerolineae bacterium]|nr:glycosyltransferase family 39 protein [Anaerolineae bacterium]MDW8297818.1 glycosyltransferase family 39 protein [Anaerolineae bacterium]
MSRTARLILLAYFLFAFLYSLITPLLEASDELWHYPMVQYLATHGFNLPVQKTGVQTAWRQEGSQPPLYYLLAAALTFAFDTSDLSQIRYINPHADIGVIVPDRNVNMTIHTAARNAASGTVRAIYLSRWLSIVLGALTVWLTYRLAQELFPQREGVALLAMATVAFNPMFLFISASVNNDNLSNMLATALLVCIARLIKQRESPSMRELVLIGVLSGAGMLAKFNIGFLLPIIACALALNALRAHSLRAFVFGAAVTGGLTILIGAWWYVRNWQLYGDPTGLNVFLDIVGRRPVSANAAQLWSERHTFLMSYWGFFGGVNVPFADFVYTVFNSIAALCAVGLLRAAFGRHLWQVNALWLARAVSLAWIAVLFSGLLRWTSETWASQGRLMFAAIAPISIWLALGAWQIGGKHLARLVAAWYVFAAIAGLITIFSAYNPPVLSSYPPDSDLRSTAFSEPESPDTTALVLHSEHLLELTAQPAEYVMFHLNFQQTATMRRDWSLFVHLENEAGTIVAQRDVFLGEGLWATSQMRHIGQFWQNRVAVRLPDHTYAPQTLTVWLGFYDLKTGERMWAYSNGLRSDRVRVGTVRVVPRRVDSDIPNPMRANLGDAVALVGYDIQPLSAQVGETLTLTLYWQRLRPLQTDYRVFAQLVQPNTSNVYAQSDGMPASWTRPTSTWQEGEIIVDQHKLTVREGTPLGDWTLIVGMYELRKQVDREEFIRLRLHLPDGAQAEDFVTLTRLRVR